MRLILDDGQVFAGRSFGAARDVAGEVVFNTGMTGYVQALTDPSYRGQILVLTYPLQGNYGVPRDGFESGRIQVQGLVVQRHTTTPSHHATTQSLAQWLVAEGIPAVHAVDTRSITRHLRAHGTVRGRLALGDGECATVDMATVAESVVGRELAHYSGGDPRILVIDTGVKESIIRALQRRGATVIRAPFVMPWETLLDDIDGVVLGNGPGDPACLGSLVERLRTVLARRIPTLGICLGHQLLALAAGARTYKLPFGHRSQNQPVQHVLTKRAFITSQNHGYAVDESSIPDGWEITFRNLNDTTNEGIAHRTEPFSSVQFHPEGAPGPRDTEFVFDDFIRLLSARVPRAAAASVGRHG